jgi:hypothetical protein
LLFMQADVGGGEGWWRSGHVLRAAPARQALVGFLLALLLFYGV